MSAPLLQKLKPLRFANYDLVHFLGRGGMGEVWSVLERSQVNRRDLAAPRTADLIRDPLSLQKSLAIKVMNAEISAETSYRQMFVHESNIAMQFDCANIVSVFKMGEYDSMLYMVMQRVDGVNLFEFHQRVLATGSRVPLDVAVYIIYSILTALFVAHGHISNGKPAGIIHRDIKPGNVMVSSVGDILLTDFGIARPVVQLDEERSGMPGTLRYMAPEQARGIAGIASDLFAVGAIFEELLTGKPFRNWCRSNRELERAISEHRIQELDRTLPSELDYLRKRLLDPDPARRFASAREAMSLISMESGYGARLKIVDLYESLVGDRSSGHTRSHRAATPSFLVERHHRLESNITAPEIPMPAPVSAPTEEDKTTVYHPRRSDDDDDDIVNHMMPWLDEEEPLAASPKPDTDAPIRFQRHEAGLLRSVAVAPAEVRTSVAEPELAKPSTPAITPTDVLTSLAEPKPTNPSSPAITPTDVLTSIADAPAKPPRTSPKNSSAHAPRGVDAWAPPSSREQEDRDHRSACGTLTPEPMNLRRPPSLFSRWAPKTRSERWMTLLLLAMLALVAGLGAALLVGGTS